VGFELAFLSVSAWSTLLLALLASCITLPASYHPTPLFQLLIGKMADRVNSDKTTVTYTAGASLLLSFLLTTCILISVGLLLNLAYFPKAFEIFILFLFIDNPYTNRSLKRVALLLKQQQRPAAKELLSPYIRRDTQHLSETGIIKALIENQCLNYVRVFLLPLLFFYLFGFMVCFAYCLLALCARVYSKQSVPDNTFSTATNRICSVIEYLPIRLFCLPLLLKPKAIGLRYLKLYVSGSYHRNSTFLLSCLAGSTYTQLGGPAKYQGKRYSKIRIGPTQLPQLSDIKKNQNAMIFTSLFWLCLFIVMDVIYAI
jgi:adenosylcobinamide-phosphate synthase